MLDLKYTRSHFPALHQDFVFMDNAGGSHTCQYSINKISKYLSHYNVQHGASYKVSQEASQKLSQSHDKFVKWINAENANEVVVYSSATMLLRILSLTLSESWNKGDEVIITNTDHEANVSCWKDLEKRGIVIKTWEFDKESFELSLDELKKLLNPRTKLVTMAHTSNIFGSIMDISTIADLVHQNDALFCVDGVAFAPHRRVDVQKLKVDFYVFSCYKIFGPHIGLMYGKEELLKNLPGINHSFIKSSPYKLQPGNYNYELTYGLSGVYDYLLESAKHHELSGNSESESLENIYQSFADHEERLCRLLLNYLNSVDEIKIIGRNTADQKKRVATISFIHDKLSSDNIVQRVDSHHIGIRYGDFYAKGIHASLDLDQSNGVVRVSLVHYNTEEEVKKLIDVFKTIFG